MINEFYSDKDIGNLFFVGLFFGVLSQPIVGALADKINKRKIIISLFIFHLIWPILLNNFIFSIVIIYISIIFWGIASTSLYTVTLAYLGERINIAEISIAVSVFIIIFEFGEFIGPISVGLVMDIYGNNGFIYSAILFSVLSLLVGLLRVILKR